MQSDDEMKPGWDAITLALKNVYADQTPTHFAPEIPPALGGSFPYHGVSLYRSDEGSAHWHAVTFGLSELFEKESDNEQLSGHGFEFTLRVPRVDGQDGTAIVTRLLEPLGQYVVKTGNSFAHGQRIPMNFQASMPDTQLAGLAICLDPELGSIETVNGRVSFLQVVGITKDELGRCREASAANDSSDCLFQALKTQSPMLVMDFERDSLLADDRLREPLEACFKALV